MVDFDRLIQMFYDDYGDLAGAAGHLEPSCDSAVAQFPKHANSVGFLPVHTCPGATWGEGGCGPVCYARHGRGQFPKTQAKLARNTAVLIDFCDQGDIEGLSREFEFLIDQSVRQFDNRLAREARLPRWRLHRQMKMRGPIFRFQWAGDLIHEVHARAIHRACTRRPRVTCWLYTRSFHLLSDLEPVPQNLTVWLSVDVQNEQEGMEAHERHPWTRIAHMRDDVEGVICPKYRYLPTERACARCGICFSSQATQIVFPIKMHLSGLKPNPFESQSELLHIKTA